MKPCNRCNKVFKATGPFNRTCPDCAVKNRDVSKLGGKAGNYKPNMYQPFNIESTGNSDLTRYL